MSTTIAGDYQLCDFEIYVSKQTKQLLLYAIIC